MLPVWIFAAVRSARTALQKPWVWGVLGVLALGALGWWGYRQVVDARQATTIAELRLAGQLQVTATTAARLASVEPVVADLTASLDAAKKLNGTLVAALAIKVPKRETTVVYVAVPTTIGPDSTREAAFRDSTFAGIIAGTMIAPPFPADLRLQYTLTRPAFTPEVGFVQIGDSVAATVTWGEEHVTIVAPFWRPPSRKPAARFGVLGRANYVVVGDLPSTGQLGLFLAPLARWQLQLVGTQEVAKDGWGKAGIAVGVEYRYGIF